jgi:hypothetical protein
MRATRRPKELPKGGIAGAVRGVGEALGLSGKE